MKYKRKSDDEETTYWLSYSDMMAALLLVFVLIIYFTMLQAKMQYETKEAELVEQQKLMEEQKALLAEQESIMEEQQKQLDDIVGVRADLIEALKEEFNGTDLSVSVDSQTGAITLDSSILFDVNKSELKESGQEFLEKFLPRYLNVILGDRFNEYISEIIIEGHTDTNGTYLYNLQLSQNRALAVASFCLQDNNAVLSNKQAEELRAIVTANGKSYSNPIYNSDNTVSLEASRRVEFKFRLKDEEMVEEMIKILNAE
jgi:chemotaxis protein MotB